MSQDFFDEVVGAASRDGTIDKGWTEIKASSGSKADMETILTALQNLYWKGMRREIASAIVALSDFDEYQPEALPVELPANEELLSSEKLKSLLDLWSPFDGGKWPKEFDDRKPEIQSIHKRVEEGVIGFFEQEPLRKRRARSLLQALGFLDIDFAREHRQPSFRSWGQRPQVDDDQAPMLMARQCSECRHCIRSFHFYECVEGCVDNTFQRNMTKMKPLVKEKGNGSFNMRGMDDILHQISLGHLVTAEPPFRLCPTCVASSSHPREHLRAIRGFAKGGDKEVMGFARELDIWEDHLDGRSLLSLGTIVLDKLALGPRKRISSRHFFPAGNAHSAMMFGPLLIENGMTRDPGGALISLRNTPNLTASSSKDLVEFMADPSDWQINNEGEEIVHNELLSVSADRRLYTATKPVRERRFISARKQVAGGLFTGHCSRFKNPEEDIITGLMESTNVWAILKSRNGTQTSHRKLLNDLAEGVTEMIKQAFEFEVNKNLVCFAGRLEKQVKLQYNRISNNCQDFCNAMLLNEDVWDQLFDSTYPPVPSNRIHESEHVQLRYMMSFAGKMLHPMDEMPFVNPLVSSIPLYDSFGQNDADLIDHVTSIRLKMDPNHHGITMDAETHDEFLLKDAEFTCPRELDGNNFASRKPCTQASHLLDGPHDNLSVLTFHIHRPRSQYTIRNDDFYRDEFLSTHGPSAWITHRLEVLHRLLLLNTYLAHSTSEFQSPTSSLRYEQIFKAWNPPSSFFARAWHSNKRNGNELERPKWQAEMHTQEYALSMTSIAMLHTHPFMQAHDVWKSRLANIKRRLFDDTKDKTGLFKEIPWTNCNCEQCIHIFAIQNCSRARSYMASQRHREPAARKYVKSHPDYVSLEKLRKSIETLEQGNVNVTALLTQLEETPEYLEAT